MISRLQEQRLFELLSVLQFGAAASSEGPVGDARGFRHAGHLGRCATGLLGRGAVSQQRRRGMANDGPSQREVEEEGAWTAVYEAIDRGLQPGANLEIPAAHLIAVKQLGLAGLVADYLGENLDDNLREQVVPTFWGYFEGRQEEVGSWRWVYGAVREAVAFAAEASRIRRSLLQGLSQALELEPSAVSGRLDAFHARLAALVFNTAPPDFEHWMAVFFRTTLKSWHQRWHAEARRGGEEGMMMDVGSDEEEDEDEGQMDVEGEEGAAVSEEDVLATWQALRELQWLPLLQAIVTDVLRSEIEQHIDRTCRGRYERKMLEVVSRWKQAVLMPWLGALLAGPEALSVHQPSTEEEEEELSPPLRLFREWQLRHDFSVYEVFSGVRISEMFDIIREFPESLPAVRELRDALDITQQHRQLAASLRETMKKRLLHNGANTMQIIDVYISTIKALRVVDPTDVLLEAVARPIRAYLRARKDTVRCIVTSLTDENSGDLHEELRRQDALPLEQGVDSDDEEAGPGENWQPPSHDADLSLSSKRRGDILSMLVSIYGSKELFVSEYRLMLADKLLNNLDYHTDKEVQNLELLKLRFGEASLHHCEIMIRDVDDSKRVNTNVRSSMAKKREAAGHQAAPAEEESAAAVVDTTIVSHHFWPPLQEDDLQLHPRVSSLLQEYGDTYGLLKNPRKLDFKPQLGTVQLELDFEGGVRRSFTVSALHATLILHFQDTHDWSLQDLGRVTGVSSDVVAKKMMLWVNQGVVAMGPSGGTATTYSLITQQEAAPQGQAGRSLEEDDVLVAAVSSDAQEAQMLTLYRDYVVGMLTSHGGRTLRQIHNTLKLWVGGEQGKYAALKLPELQAMLARLCAEERSPIEFVDGIYQLVARQQAN